LSRVVTGQDLIHRTELTYTPERRWWTREAHTLNVNVRVSYTSDLLPQGSVLHLVKVEGKGSALGEDIGFGMQLVLVSAARPTFVEIDQSVPVIAWGNDPSRCGWLAFGTEVDEAWPLHITLSGSARRLCVSFLGFLVDNGDLRVSVLYTPG